MTVFDWVVREIYWIGAALAAVAAFARWVWPRVKRINTLNTIAQQFSPNGGTTLRDAIDRIEGIAKASQKASAEAQKTAADALRVCLDQNVTLASISEKISHVIETVTTK